MTLEQFNQASEAEVRGTLGECCGSMAWIGAMLLRRPFPTTQHFLRAADEVWWRLGEADWLEAFAQHPAIGENRSDGGWSEREQSGMRNSSAAVGTALARGNRAYLEKFGYIYIVCATGKTGEEMLAILEARLRNDPAAEIRAAAEEQSKITRLRLQRLLSA